MSDLGADVFFSRCQLDARFDFRSNQMYVNSSIWRLEDKILLRGACWQPNKRVLSEVRSETSGSCQFVFAANVLIAQPCTKSVHCTHFFRVDDHDDA